MPAWNDPSPSRPPTAGITALLGLGLLLLLPVHGASGPSQAQAAAGGAPPPSGHPNVLFIVVDDLNHWVGHLGRNRNTKTPNLDRLATRGTTFTHAYCAAPSCNPSRTAALSGLRPSSSGVYDNATPWTNHVDPRRTLNAHFRAQGYKVYGAGKVYHGASRGTDWDDWGDEGSPAPEPPTDRSIGGIRFAPLDCADTDLPDARIADYGIGQLRRRQEKPFLLALGFHKPHMPWNVPRRYFDLFPTNQLLLPPSETNDLADVPAAGVRMAHASGDHEAVLKSGRWLEAVQAYLASIAFVDAQVGRVLDALDASPHASNTVICLWGDHGWHLGEKEHWRKFALWEEATRAPLIWVAPGVTTPGTRCNRTVDFVSLYPTLCDVAGLPKPAHLEGQSLLPLLRDARAGWSTPALTTHGFQNHAVRTEEWRYIRYADGGEELYQERRDPFEWDNLASRPEYNAIKQELSRSFPAHNTPTPPRTP